MMFRQFLTQDTRFALRLLRKSPASTAAGILMLAIGIGINSAIFSFVQGLLFRPLLLPDMESLISIWSQNPRQRKGKIGHFSGGFQRFQAAMPQLLPLGRLRMVGDGSSGKR